MIAEAVVVVMVAVLIFLGSLAFWWSEPKVDFGDSVLRHPSQLYESVFFVLFFIYCLARIERAQPGYLFFLLMNCYFAFRFAEEFIRYNDQYYWGLSVFQYISLFALAFINLNYYLEKTKRYGRVLSE